MVGGAAGFAAGVVKAGPVKGGARREQLERGPHQTVLLPQHGVGAAEELERAQRIAARGQPAAGGQAVERRQPGDSLP